MKTEELKGEPRQSSILGPFIGNVDADETIKAFLARNLQNRDKGQADDD